MISSPICTGDTVYVTDPTHCLAGNTFEVTDTFAGLARLKSVLPLDRFTVPMSDLCLSQDIGGMERLGFLCIQNCGGKVRRICSGCTSACNEPVFAYPEA